MRRFVIRLALFSIPFWIYAAFIWTTDPFDLLPSYSLISESTKQRISGAANPPLWKMSRFMKSTAPNILLGDSRMGHIRVQEIKAITGEDYVNLSCAGGKLIEIIRMFWFAARHRHLKSVVVAINFDTYNQHGTEDRTGTYESIKKDPLLYFVDHTVMEAAAYEFKADVLGRARDLESPNMSPEQFWEYQLEFAANHYRVYAPPAWAKPELKKITEYCQHNDICLVFIILPSHVDLQNIVKVTGRAPEYRQFKEEIAGLATTYDYDYPNSLTRDRENFSDPFHFSDATGDLLVHDIWLGKLQYGRKLEPQSVTGDRPKTIATTDIEPQTRLATHSAKRLTSAIMGSP